METSTDSLEMLFVCRTSLLKIGQHDPGQAVRATRTTIIKTWPVLSRFQPRSVGRTQFKHSCYKRDGSTTTFAPTVVR